MTPYFKDNGIFRMLAQRQTLKLNKTLTFALVPEGKDSCIEAVIVVAVKTVVIPNETRAGAAWASIQKDIHDIMTSKRLGMYTVKIYV